MTFAWVTPSADFSDLVFIRSRHDSYECIQLRWLKIPTVICSHASLPQLFLVLKSSDLSHESKKNCAETESMEIAGAIAIKTSCPRSACWAACQFQKPVLLQRYEKRRISSKLSSKMPASLARLGMADENNIKLAMFLGSGLDTLADQTNGSLVCFRDQHSS